MAITVFDEEGIAWQLHGGDPCYRAAREGAVLLKRMAIDGTKLRLPRSFILSGTPPEKEEERLVEEVTRLVSEDGSVISLAERLASLEMALAARLLQR